MAAVEEKTYGEQRSEVEVLVDAAVLARVKAGMALLEEKYGPDWAAKIDLDELDLSSPTACVLGQVYADQVDKVVRYGRYENSDGYRIGLRMLGIADGGSEYGFTTPDEDDPGVDEDEVVEWNEMTEAWKLALTGVV